VVLAWHDALNNGDLDGALALMTEDATISGWRPPVRGVLDWWFDIKTHYGVQDCQQDGEQLACDVIMTDDGCITASGNTHGLQLRHIFSMQDGKIHEVSYGEVANTEDWDRYWKWTEEEGAWAETFRAEEWAKTDRATNSDAGEVAIKLCQDYADFLEEQVPVITTSAQALVSAINSGDVDAALALLADDAKYAFWKDKAAGPDQLRAIFNWLAGKETQYQISDCEWQSLGVQCGMTVVDGCITASGASDGLPGMMTFNVLEDGTLQSVVGVLSFSKRKPYETWLEAEAAWAGANRADELAQAEGYSQEAGAMAVKLCQEYAETLK
jgi:ketosteroid isomerase-like protein